MCRGNLGGIGAGEVQDLEVPGNRDTGSCIIFIVFSAWGGRGHHSKGAPSTLGLGEVRHTEGEELGREH